MKNRFFRKIILFLIVILLFSGCKKAGNRIIYEEEKTTSIEVLSEENQKSDSEDNVVINNEIQKETIEVEKETVFEDEKETEENKTEEQPAVPVCSLTVRCDDILKNIEKLKEEKRSLIPENGIIYENNAVNFTKGESVFDILHSELIKNRIHFEFSNIPMYNSAYIEGIGNLYEFDCGSLSGWMYKVNGVKPNFGCSQYVIKENDKIEFYYSCNFMEDNE